MVRALVRVSLVLGILAAAAGAWHATRPAVPDPPAIAALGDMDVEVRALLTELHDAIVRAPREAEPWGRFAMGCEANGFVGAARDAYGVAAALAPGEPRWQYRLALLTARLGDTGAALEALARVNEGAPGYAPAWARRGAWLLDRGDSAGAESAFRRAMAIQPDNLAAAIGLARVHLGRRADGLAAAALERALEQHPGDRYALQLLGTAYRRMGRLDDASFALAVGAAGEPTVDDPWSAEVGEYRRGFATLLKAATAEAMDGRFDRALAILDDLRRRHPDDRSLTHHTAEILTSAGRPREAVALLAPIVDAGGDTAETHVALAGAYLAADDLARAGAHADRAIAARAPGARAHTLKGLAAWRAGRRGEAAVLLEQALARDPRDVRLLAWIGWIDLEERRARQALPAFVEVLRRDPLQPDALAGLALAQGALGSRDEALVTLARAEQAAPGHPRVREARGRLQAEPR